MHADGDPADGAERHGEAFVHALGDQLRLRFGLDGEKPRTLEEVGEVFNVTRERVRQIQNIALRKLRKMMREQDNLGEGRA